MGVRASGGVVLEGETAGEGECIPCEISRATTRNCALICAVARNRPRAVIRELIPRARAIPRSRRYKGIARNARRK